MPPFSKKVRFVTFSVALLAFKIAPPPNRPLATFSKVATVGVAFAAVIAARRLPKPLSLVVVTVIVAA